MLKQAPSRFYRFENYEIDFVRESPAAVAAHHTPTHLCRPHLTGAELKPSANVRGAPPTAGTFSVASDFTGRPARRRETRRPWCPGSAGFELIHRPDVDRLPGSEREAYPRSVAGYCYTAERPIGRKRNRVTTRGTARGACSQPHAVIMPSSVASSHGSDRQALVAAGATAGTALQTRCLLVWCCRRKGQ
jgi:hypothetical protein